MIRRAIGLRAAVAAAFLSTAGVSALASGTVQTAAAMPGSHIHVMRTLTATLGDRETTRDCVLPLVISIECVGAGTPMSYGGGAIQTSEAVYIVRWGWTSDPSGQASYQERFFQGVGGTSFAASQTQYCDSTTLLGLQCTSGAHHVGNSSGLWNSGRTWVDSTNPVPSSPTDADIQAEAIRAAAHFGNTTAASNAGAQYIIDTPTGRSTSGFGTQWCAYHGAATSSYGLLSYTDFPYQTDAGAGCGENFINSGSAGLLDGVSIVGGHEYSESATDPDPPNGWTDTIGAENGDKCAWISFGPGATHNITVSTGTFAVQTLWSNAANGGAGGCA